MEFTRRFHRVALAEALRRRAKDGSHWASYRQQAEGAVDVVFTVQGRTPRNAANAAAVRELEDKAAAMPDQYRRLKPRPRAARGPLATTKAAYHKARNRRKEDPTFADSCEFFLHARLFIADRRRGQGMAYAAAFDAWMDATDSELVEVLAKYPPPPGQ